MMTTTMEGVLQATGNRGLFILPQLPVRMIACFSVHALTFCPERGYPSSLRMVAQHIQQPQLVELTQRFLWEQLNPEDARSALDIPLDLLPQVSDDTRLAIFHSAVAMFYAPSDSWGAGGMMRERIRCNPCWRDSYARHDTVLTDAESQTRVALLGMRGMDVARVYLFFSIRFRGVLHSCALVHLFSLLGDAPDADTGQWIVRPQYNAARRRRMRVIPISRILRSTLLLPVFGSGHIADLDGLDFPSTLDVFQSFYVNSYADHHSHEFIF
jgi:hypothetical protein